MILQGGVKRQVYGPLCDLHWDHWSWRGLAIQIAAAAVGVLLVLGAPLMLLERPHGQEGIGTALWMIGWCSCPCFVVVAIVLPFTAVRIKGINKQIVILSGVAPEFVEALRVHREARLQAGGAIGRGELPGVGATIAAVGPMAESARWVLERAQQVAHTYNYHYLGTEHLLCALSEAGAGAADHILVHCGIDHARLWTELLRSAPADTDAASPAELPPTPRLKKLLANARTRAQQWHPDPLDAEHLLLAVLEEREGTAAAWLATMGLNIAEAHRKLLFLLNPNGEE
jgi:hypothetical protein